MVISLKKIFSTPKLHKGKAWYILYSYRDPISQTMHAFKITKGLNVGNEDQRMRNAQRIIANLTKKLENGWSPFEERFGKKNLSSPNNWINAISDFLRFKATENIEERSFIEYSYKLNKFIKFIKEKKWDKLNVSLFTYEHALEFMEWLKANGCRSGKTLKEYKSIMGQVCNHLRKKQLITQNFFELLPHYKYISNTPRLFSDKELQELKNYALQCDRQLWIIFQFILYCFFRPGREVRLMRVGDIDYEKGILWSRKDTAKNDKEKPVIIPDHFLKYLIQNGYHKANKEDFMFTVEGKPGSIPVGKNYIYKHYKKARLALGINTYIYAAKHTGNRKLKDNGADLLDMMKQNRHSSPNQTYVYLKSLEDEYNMALKDKFFTV